jgi:anti-sigma factor ChrR (cupin superfamily)
MMNAFVIGWLVCGLQSERVLVGDDDWRYTMETVTGGGLMAPHGRIGGEKTFIKSISNQLHLLF